jgi:alpha-galactosidase
VSENSIVLIGAGSTVFTPGLMTDLASSRTFDGWTVHLVDLNGEAAETMARVGRRIAAEQGAELTFVPHVDRREALPDARFVTTTIAVGAAAGWRTDVEVPARYGIAQTVGDSVGPGGVLRALRHVPELVAIARDVADLAPEAQMINYSNPLTANVRAITSQTGVKAVGLCHGTMHTLSKLTADLGVPADEVHAVFAGLNHLCWLLDLRRGAEDLYPLLRKAVAERAGGIDAASTRDEGVHLPVSADLMRTFGLYPAPGDRHVAEFFGHYLRAADGGPADEKDLPWGLQGGRDATMEYIGEKDDLWELLHAQADGKAALPTTDNQEAERLVVIAEALVTGNDHVELAVNLPNEGKISNLPPTAVVEVPAVVGAAGITGLGVGPLPDAIAAVLTARAHQQEITVQAALTGDRSLALQALTLDPLVGGLDIATRILDDAIEAHGSAMSRFTATEAAA